METVTNERRHYDGNKKIHQEFSVCQVEDYSFVNLDSEYSFIGKTDEEKSLVCLTSEVPPNVIRRDDGWKALRIQGVLEFSLIGILSKIAAILRILPGQRLSMTYQLQVIIVQRNMTLILLRTQTAMKITQLQDERK